MTSVSQELTHLNTPQNRLLDRLAPFIQNLGFELVHLETQTHQGKVLRIYIDRLNSDEPVGVEDCAKVSRELDAPLESLSEVNEVFSGTYDLEVSSPGVDRPLRLPKDFVRFTGREARIHTFRALTADELKNADYQKRNPKQKNFLGTLSGMEGNSVKLSVSPTMGTTRSDPRPGKSKKKSGSEKKDEILLPLTLIAKANLEPVFDLND